MFMNPAIPGIPVYLTGGIIITGAFEPRMGFWPACAFACACAWGCKMITWPFQQIGFGVWMSHHVAIRRACAVNSVTIRAVKRILKVPGLSWHKVCVLVGGWDWPVSVLPGILRLSVIQMMIGASPCAFLSVPLSLSGAFFLRPDDAVLYSAASTMFAVATITQFVALGLALHYIEKEAFEHYDELVNEPPDLEVLALDKLEEKSDALFAKYTDWHGKFRHFPVWMKINMTIGAVAGALSCYLLTFLTCFNDFSITDKIDEKLGGKITNIVRLPGWIALALSGLSILCYILWRLWLCVRISNMTDADQKESATTYRLASQIDLTHLRTEVQIHPKETPAGEPKAAELDNAPVAVAAAAAAEVKPSPAQVEGKTPPPTISEGAEPKTPTSASVELQSLTKDKAVADAKVD